jgi:hypothetical protein
VPKSPQRPARPKNDPENASGAVRDAPRLRQNLAPACDILSGLSHSAALNKRAKVFTFYVKSGESFYVLRKNRRKFLRSVENISAAAQ